MELDVEELIGRGGASPELERADAKVEQKAMDEGDEVDGEETLDDDTADAMNLGSLPEMEGLEEVGGYLGKEPDSGEDNRDVPSSQDVRSELNATALAAEDHEPYVLKVYHESFTVQTSYIPTELPSTARQIFINMNHVDGADDPQTHPPFAAQDTLLLSPWLRSLPIANSPLENITSFINNIDVNDRDSIHNLAFQDSLYDTLSDDILRLYGKFANLNKFDFGGRERS